MVLNVLFGTTAIGSGVANGAILIYSINQGMGAVLVHLPMILVCGWFSYGTIRVVQATHVIGNVP